MSLKWKLLFTYALKELRNKEANIVRIETKLSDLAMLKVEKKNAFITCLFKNLLSYLIKLHIQRALCRRGKRMPGLVCLFCKILSGENKNKKTVH